MKSSEIAKKIIVIIVLLGLWQVIVSIFHISAYIFPGPLKIFNAFVQNGKVIFNNAAITLTEAFLGFLIANLIIIAIAFFISFYSNL